MLVEILVAHADRKIGDTVELDDSEASRLVSGRWAIPAKPKVDRAVKAPVLETRRAKGKK